MKKIKIDPGHGGKDPGGVANGLQEKNVDGKAKETFTKILAQKKKGNR
nr:N-acetylmuramoyl-L-alanine amidase [Bacillus cihuensis]